jgi:hypothetical protein
MGASVAKVKTGSREVDQLQSNILSKLNGLLSEPLLGGHIIDNVALTAPTIDKPINSIPHGLDQILTGWILTRIHGPVSSPPVIFDAQNINQTPNKTLNLVTTADVTVNIYVF